MSLSHKKLSQKKVFLMAGYPGSGKSTLANTIAETIPAQYISSDGVREQIFQSHRYDPRGDEAILALKGRVYSEVAKIALDHIKNGHKVVIDATNLETPNRDLLTNLLLKKLSTDELIFVLVKTPYKTMLERMRKHDQEKNTEDENMFEAWKRVHGYFKARSKRGLVSWPNNSNIDNISAKKMYEYLAK